MLWKHSIFVVRTNKCYYHVVTHVARHSSTLGCRCLWFGRHYHTSPIRKNMKENTILVQKKNILSTFWFNLGSGNYRWENQRINRRWLKNCFPWWWFFFTTTTTKTMSFAIQVFLLAISDKWTLCRAIVTQRCLEVE